MVRTDRYGATTMVREPEVRLAMDPEARATRMCLHGPAREFAMYVMAEFPMLSDYQVDKCVSGWLKGQLMERTGQARLY